METLASNVQAAKQMRPGDSLHLRPCSLSSLLHELFSKYDPLYLQSRKSAAGTGETPPRRGSQQHVGPGTPLHPGRLPPTSWVPVSTAAHGAREPRGPTERSHQTPRVTTAWASPAPAQPAPFPAAPAASRQARGGGCACAGSGLPSVFAQAWGKRGPVEPWCSGTAWVLEELQRRWDSA